MSASGGDSPVGGTVNEELITFGDDGKVDRQGFEGLLVLLESGKARTPELLGRLLVSIWTLQSIDILLTQWPQTDLDTPPNISKQAQHFIKSIVRLQEKIGGEALRVAQPAGSNNSRERVDGRHDPPPDTTEREDAAPEDGLKGKSVAGGNQPPTIRSTRDTQEEDEEERKAIPKPSGGKGKKRAGSVGSPGDRAARRQKLDASNANRREPITPAAGKNVGEGAPTPENTAETPTTKASGDVNLEDSSPSVKLPDSIRILPAGICT